MPEVLPDHAPMPRAFLAWDGTRYRVCSVDAAGQLQVDVIASGLPAGAATAANQALLLARLQIIDNLVNALQSVNTDALQVRGEDQLFSYQGALASFRAAVVSGAGGYIDSLPVPAGTIWKVTQVVARDQTSPITEIQWYAVIGGAVTAFGNDIRAIAAGELVSVKCEVWLDATDTIRPYFTGSLAGDTCHVWLTGHEMTLEV